MSKDRPIKYEPHPVSQARKAELIAAGFRIVDAKFAPKEAPTEPRRADMETVKARVGKLLDEKTAAAKKPRAKAKRK